MKRLTTLRRSNPDKELKRNEGRMSMPVHPCPMMFTEASPGWFQGVFEPGQWTRGHLSAGGNHSSSIDSSLPVDTSWISAWFSLPRCNQCRTSVHLLLSLPSLIVRARLFRHLFPLFLTNLPLVFFPLNLITRKGLSLLQLKNILSLQNLLSCAGLTNLRNLGNFKSILWCHLPLWELFPYGRIPTCQVQATNYKLFLPTQHLGLLSML